MVSTQCLKYYCFAYNFLFLVSGFLLLSFTSVLFYRLILYNAFIVQDVFNPLYSLFGVSFLIFMCLWLGWKGVTREHQPHVLMFSATLVIIIGLEIGIGFWNLVEYHTYEDETTTLMKESYLKYISNQSDFNIWNRVQTKMRCCGLEGPAGYHDSIPASCCVLDLGPDGAHQSSCPGIYQRGCLTPLKDYIGRQIINTLALCFFMAVIQVCGVFSTFAYSKALLRERLQARRSLNQSMNVEDNLLNRRHSSITG